jgi:hypothetical protein
MKSGNNRKRSWEMAQVTIEKVRAVTAPGFQPCFEYAVYVGDKLIRTCPSLGMAREVAAGY